MKSRKQNLLFKNAFDRRTFVSTMTKVTGSAILFSPLASAAHLKLPTQSWTVSEVMDLFIREVPGAPFGQSVDTLKSGNRDTRVKGIVTTMFATIDVIQKAIALNANFIIAHEPTFYNHLDDTSWLTNDAVYQYKADLLKKNDVAIWRNHDYIHRLVSDGVMAGVLDQLEWTKYAVARDSNVLELPDTTLGELIIQLKRKLGISTVRYIGTLTESCKKILLMPGASGGRSQISAISKVKPDVVVCGEISEWETAEYVRDARAKGDQLGLVILGHVASEEPGSAFLAQWLNERITEIKTTHIPAGNSLMFA
jgi:putative NIF3 family GTP cyclohydrolase 1 type 2